LGGSYNIPPNDISAREAAVIAAMKRSKVKNPNIDRHRPIPVTVTPQQKMVVVIDNDDITQCKQRTVAGKRKRSLLHGYDYQPGEKVIVIERSGQTRGPFPIVRVHISGHVTIREIAGCENNWMYRSFVHM
jgi:hypothetical protein